MITPLPHDVLLVLDGSTGQNAFNKAQEFTKASDVLSLKKIEMAPSRRLLLEEEMVCLLSLHHGGKDDQRSKNAHQT